MPIDERDRHRLYLKLEEVLGPQEAGILMDHLPPGGWVDLATRADLERLGAELRAELHAETTGLRADLNALEHRLSARMDRMARQLVMWTSGMVLATGGLAFAAGRFA